jgi:hypothetical protein
MVPSGTTTQDIIMPSEFHYPAKHPIKSVVTILNGQTVSSTYELYVSAKMFNVVPKAIRIPTTLLGTNLTFEVATEDSDFQFLRINNVLYNIDYTQLGQWEPLAADIFPGFRLFRVSANANQVADIDIEILNYIV